VYGTTRYGVQGRIATITLNRPAKLNAIRPTMLEEIALRSAGKHKGR
jgi:enoyl-CoA hydratase/carnithine racemase